MPIPNEKEIAALKWLITRLGKAEDYCRPYFERGKRHYMLYRFSTAVSDADWPYVNRVRSRDILAFVEDTTAIMVQTLFATMPFISVIPRESGNSFIQSLNIDLVKIANQLERLLDYQLSHEDTDFFEEIIDYFKDGAIQGNSYMGVYPKFDASGIYILPMLKNHGFWDVLPVPGSKRLSRSRGIFVREFQTMDDLTDLQNRGVYKNVEQIKDRSNDTDMWHKQLLEECGVTNYSDMDDIEVIHYFSGGHVITFANRRVFLRDTTTPLPNGTFNQPYPYAMPVVQYKYNVLPNEFFGMGIPEILEVLQEDKNLIRSARRDNIDLCINKILLTKEGSDINYDLIRFFPGAIWPEMMGRVEPFEIQDVTQSAYAEEKTIGADMENALSLFGYARGMTPEHCVDDQTEILTDEGWKFFKDLNRKEQVLTVNLKTKKYEWQTPTDYIIQDYEGWMIEGKNHNINFKVTPNHKMIVADQGDNLRLTEFSGIRVGDRIPRVYEWDGIRPNVYYHTEEIKIGHRDDGLYPPMADWVSFIGIFISEGHARGDSKHGYTVEIAQENETKKDIIRKLLQRLVLSFKERRNGFYIYNKDLCLWLMENIGKKQDKHIPKKLKELCPELLSEMFHWMMLGDGTQGKTKNKGKIYPRQTYTTNSKKLADDIQEIVLKMGKNATIHFRPARKVFDKKQNKTYQCKEEYDITILNSKTVNGFQSKTHKFSNIWYKGFVYCIQIPNKTMVTRRNGQTLITGRSEQPTTVMKLQQAALNRTDVNIKLVEYTVLQEIARKVVMLDRRYMKQADYEAILGEPDAGFYKLPLEYINRCYTIKPVGSSVTNIKEVRQQQIQFALQTLMNIPPQLMQANTQPFTVDYYELLKEALDVADVKTIDRILIPLKQQQGQGGDIMGMVSQIMQNPQVLSGLMGGYGGK